MGYQNVGKPRFFIDNYQYLRTMGLDPEAYMEGDIPDDWEGALFNESSGYKTIFENPNAFILDPIQSKRFNVDTYGSFLSFLIPMGNQVQNMDFSGNMKWYCAILNHDIPYTISQMSFNIAPQSGQINSDFSYTNVLNAERNIINQKGSSIFYTDLTPTGDDINENIKRYTGFILLNDGAHNFINIGAISMGVMYTMPHSPDLELTMEIENDGYKSVTTQGGSTLTNINFTGAPNWTNGGQFINPFGVGDYSDNSYLDGSKRNGRRTWNLTFSYISDKDLFSSNYMANNYTETTTDYDSDDIDTENQFEYNMFTDDSFVAQVWNKSGALGLPFIFQPDSSNNNPDQFCLAQFDQKSLKISQDAYQAYSISVKVGEIW